MEASATQTIKIADGRSNDELPEFITGHLRCAAPI
jgi:hypothetical protein